MSCVYTDILGAIKTRLTSAPSTPFKDATVCGYGSHLADSQIGEELQALTSMAPAAMVFYFGGDAIRDARPDEEAVFSVIVIAAARTITAAEQGDTAATGVLELVEWVKTALHGWRATGCVNDLRWMRNQRFIVEGLTLTVAAHRVDFKTLVAPTS